MDSTSLKRQLVEEVARIQRTNLRRVESSSGMKTIYSSENYRMSKSRGQVGQQGHHGHHAHQKPGQVRVKKNNPDHMVISADLFERHAQPNEDEEVVEKAAMQTTSAEAETFERSIESDSHLKKNHVEEPKLNPSVSDRAESEMTLPETTIQDRVGMSRVESQLSEEEHAVQGFVSLAKTQEALLDTEGGISNTINAGIAPPLTESVQFTQTTEEQHQESKVMQNLVAKARKQLVEEETIRKSVYIPLVVEKLQEKGKSVEMRETPGRNFEDINSFFDLKEIISSTPQTGSMHEGNSTPSEIGSVYSGTGSKLDRVESGTWQGSRLGSTKEKIDFETPINSDNEHDVSKTGGEESHSSVASSVVTNHGREAGSGSSAHGVEDITSSTSPTVKNAQTTRAHNLTSDSTGSSAKIEETQRIFDEMLVDLSSSMEEDFTTSRRAVGTELSSSAEVIVHSDDGLDKDNISGTQSNEQCSKKDYQQAIDPLRQSLDISMDNADISSHKLGVETGTSPTNQQPNQSNVEGRKELSSSAEAILPSIQMSETDSKKPSSTAHSPNTELSVRNEEQLQQLDVVTLDLSQQSLTGEKPITMTSASTDQTSQCDEPERVRSEQYSIWKTESMEPSSSDHLESHSDETRRLPISNRSGDETTNAKFPSGNVVNAQESLYVSVSMAGVDSENGRSEDRHIPAAEPDSPIYCDMTNLKSERSVETTLIHNQSRRDSSQSIRASMDKNIADIQRNIIQIENTEVFRDKTMTNGSGKNNALITGYSQIITERLAPIGAEKQDLGNFDFSSKQTIIATETNDKAQIKADTLMASTLERISRSYSSSSVESKSDKDNDSVWTSSGGLPPESQPKKSSAVSENAPSDMKSISHMVDVKGLAKQLETVLDFKKMMRLHSNSDQVEDNKAEEDKESITKERLVKKRIAQAQDPKNAFGQVLNEIFQKTRLRSIQSDSDTPDSSMNASSLERMTDAQNISVTKPGDYNTVSDTESIGRYEPGPDVSIVYISSDTVVGENEPPVPPGIEIDHYNKLQTQSAVKLTLPENKAEILPEQPRYDDYHVNKPTAEEKNPPIFSPSEINRQTTADDTDYRIETDEKRDDWGTAAVTEIIVNRTKPHGNTDVKQDNTERDIRKERPVSLENPYVWDYKPQRDANLNGSLTESLVTPAEENIRVTSLRQKITSQSATDEKGYKVDNFSSEKEHFEPEGWRKGNSNVFSTNEVTREGALTFQTKSPVDGRIYRYTNTSDSETTRYSSGEDELSYSPGYSGQKTTSTIYINPQPTERAVVGEFSTDEDTVEGSLLYASHGPIVRDNSGLRSLLHYEWKPAEPLRQNDINIEKKQDRSGHMTFYSSSNPEHAVKLGFDHPITARQQAGEEIFGEDEKLFNGRLLSNNASESRTVKASNLNRTTNYSLFYEGNGESFSVPQRVNDEVTEDFLHQRKYRDRSPAKAVHSSSESKYSKNKNMAYLLTGKEHLRADYNRSGHSTPQRKDLYVQEDILVSPTADEDRRGSHGSTDYLADKQAGQDFFHFRALGNSDREDDVQGEGMQRVERNEQHVLKSGPEHFETLPDTYIGSSSKAPEPVPIRIQINGAEQKPEIASQTSSVSHHDSQASSDRGGKADSTDGKKHKSGHRHTERETKIIVASQSHNGSQTNDRADYPNDCKVILIDSLDPDARRRERRENKVTSTYKTKARGDDNISISSASSQSSSSVAVAQALNSFDEAINSGSQQNVSSDNRRVHSGNSGGVQKVRVDYDPNTTRMYAKENQKPQQFVKVKDYRLHRDAHHEKRSQVHSRDNGSLNDVQYLIKSLEKETKKPHLPIPGVDRDAFSYHVTLPGNENKNRVNEVDVTTREAMRDRGTTGQGSSHVIRRYTEEKIVEDVTPETSLHVKADHGGHGGRTIVLNGSPLNRNIVFHPPASIAQSDSDGTVRFNDSRDSIKRENSDRETTYNVKSSGAPHFRTQPDNVRIVKKERTEKSYRRRHSLSSSDSGSSDSHGDRGRKPKSGKVSSVLIDFSSPQYPILSNVVHLDGASGLKTSSDNIPSQDIYSSPRDTDKPRRVRSSSESSLSDQEHHKSGKVGRAKSSDELRLSKDLYSRSQPQFKSENVFYEHYHVKRENPMYAGGDSKVLYVFPPSKKGHGNKNATREIYVDTKSHSPNRLSSSFSSISPTGSPSPDDKHVTTVSFDESYNRKRSASPYSDDAYKSKVHVKKQHVVKTDRVRSADSDNELYVRNSRSSPYRVISPSSDVYVHRRGRGSDSDGDSSRTGSHRSTINISKSPGKRRGHEAPAMLSIPLSKDSVAMTIPAMHQTKYVTNKSEKVELKRSSSLDSIRDMVDYSTTNDGRKYRSEKVLHLGSSSDSPSSPEMRSPNSPYVSTITILNRKLNVKDQSGDSGTGTEVISSDDDIRYRSQLRPVREEVVYATKPETKQRRSEQHTKTYSSYEETRNNSSYEYVMPKQHTTKVHQERRIPIREGSISPIHQDRAKTVRESLHERLSNMSYEHNQEPQRTEQSTVGSDLKVVRGQFVIRNSMDISLDEDDSLALDDNINIFDNSFTLSKENPLYQSDPDLYKKFETETVEERTRRIKDPVHASPESVQRVTRVHVKAIPRDEVDARMKDWERERVEVKRITSKPSPSSGHRHYVRYDLDVPYAEGDFGDGFEDIIKNTRATAVKSAPNKKKQNLSALLLSKLAQIDSKDITQHIDVEHHNEEIYGDISFIHADGSKSGAEDTTNFDSVAEHIDLLLKEGKALITIKVTAERIIPIDFEFNVWRKSQAIVTRNIEIDLKANDQRRRLYEHVMDTTPSKMIGSSSSHDGYRESNEAVLSSKDTLKLFSRLLSVAEKDDNAIEKDEVRYESQQRERSDSLPSLSNVDMLY